MLTKTKLKKLAICLALAAKHEGTQCDLQSETAGNRASVRAVARHPPTYFAGGSKEQREQYWALPRHMHPTLGTPGFTLYCFSSLCAVFICSPQCTKSPYTSETCRLAGFHRGRDFMPEWSHV